MKVAAVDSSSTGLRPRTSSSSDHAPSASTPGSPVSESHCVRRLASAWAQARVRSHSTHYRLRNRGTECG
jgi:hypothetical protein